MPTVLLVEDNALHAKMVEEAIAGMGVTLVTLTDGEAALRYLDRKDEFEGVAAPDLVLLDLYLPKMDGLQVLAWIRAGDIRRKIPIVVISMSDVKNIDDAYRNGANAFVSKDNNFIQNIQKTVEFWFTVAKLPTCPA